MTTDLYQGGAATVPAVLPDRSVQVGDEAMTEAEVRRIVLEEIKRLLKNVMPFFPPGSFDGASVNDACRAIAVERGGILICKDAIGILVRHGLFSSRFAAREGIYTVLRRSKYFTKVRRGVYSLDLVITP